LIVRAMLIGLLLMAGCGHGASVPLPRPRSRSPSPATRPTRGPARSSPPTRADTIYVIGLASWPADLLGRRVEVTGLLTRKKLIPDPEVNENGEHTAGAYGLQDVMEKPKWKAAQ
jgi:hypothetical protein